MTKVIRLKTKTTDRGTSWFMTSDLQVGRRLRFKSWRLGLDEVYQITQIRTVDWTPRKGGRALRTQDRVCMMNANGNSRASRVQYLRDSVHWELLDD